MPKKLFTKENAKEMQLRGAKKQGEAKRKNASFRKYVKSWGNAPLTEKERSQVEKVFGDLGIIFDDTKMSKKILLFLPILTKAINEKDLKAVQMALEWMGESSKYEEEIKKLKEENKKLKLEQKKLAIDTGDQREIEDMSALADFLVVKPGETDDSNE